MSGSVGLVPIETEACDRGSTWAGEPGGRIRYLCRECLNPHRLNPHLKSGAQSRCDPGADNQGQREQGHGRQEPRS